MIFDEAFELLIDVEGGFTRNSHDSGNWTGGKIGKGELKGTKYGISAGSYPDLDIKNITLEEAKAIYKKDYWDAVKADNFPELFRFDLFDTAVNSGAERSIKFLQKAIGVTVDGKIGPNTKLASMSIHPAIVKARFNAVRLEFMTDTGGWDIFGRGWAKRISKNLLLN